MIPAKPYLIRAIHTWLVDNDLTPYVLVDATHNLTKVPQEFVEDGKIILNLSFTAVQSLSLENDFITFQARFSGRPFGLVIPVDAVIGIFAQEDKTKGMFFQLDEESTEEDDTPPEPPKPTRPVLRRVK